MNLGLGTVQFGFDYGITNRTGRTPAGEVRAILASAAAHGIDTLDTAALYGAAESVLGETLPRPHAFRIVTKTLALESSQPTAEAVAAIVTGVHCSLERLGEERLGGLLVHRADDLLGPVGDRLFSALDALRLAGTVDRVGASVYSPEEAMKIVDRYPVDLVQLPLNPLDQRHLAAGSLAALAAAGIEIHVRSAFLQGLLLAPQVALPSALAGLSKPLSSWWAAAANLGLTPLQTCLSFLKGASGVSVAICGATRLAEWEEIVAAYQTSPVMPPDTLKELAVPDDKLIDPRFWPKS